MNLTPHALIDAGGGLLFALLGISLLVAGRATKRGRLLAGLTLAFGVAFILVNVFPPEGETRVLVLLSPVPMWSIGGAFAVALAFDVAAPLAPRPRAWFVRLAALAAAAIVLQGALIWLAAGSVDLVGTGRPLARPVAFAWISALAFEAIGFALVVGAAALRHAGAEEARARRCYAMLALGLGAFIAYNTAANAADPSTLVTFVPAFVVVAAAVLLWVRACGFADPRRARNVTLVLAAVGTLGPVVVYAGWPDAGLGGILRTLEFVVLVRAILYHDLLGAPLPRLAMDRGAVATGALAVLFVVAQVTQNFLAAEYGLLMGGVVAGAFVFAAQPIQRALEARRGPRAARLRSEEPQAAHLIEAYRSALRAALADGPLTREKEMHLGEVATRLRIPPVHAVRARHEVEDELAEPGRSHVTRGRRTEERPP